jgi:signal peptidase I
MKRYKYFIVSALSLLVGLTNSVLSSAAVEDLTIETGCGKSTARSFTAALDVPGGEYDVYARLGQRGRELSVVGFARQNESSSKCQELPEATISGDRWTRVGIVVSSSADSELIMQMQSNDLPTAPDANRPTYLLVDRANPPCAPYTECLVKVAGNAGYVRPAGTATTQNSMTAVRVMSPAADKLERVRYYVDGRLVYQTSQLESFDMRYVVLAGQKLVRVAEYASGQQIVFEEAAPETVIDTFGNFLFRIWREYSAALFWLGVFALVVLVIWVVRLVMRMYATRRQWRIDHGFMPDPTAPALTPEREKRLAVIDRIRTAISITSVTLTIGLTSLTLILFGGAFVGGLYYVDGESMQQTYLDGQKILVNKIPVSFANLNKRTYIPKRGEVVVARAQYGILDKSVNIDDHVIVKRVLALPGERVVIENGVLTVFNKEKPQGFQPDKNAKWVETMVPDEVKDRLELTLGSNELFLSGDNRPGSIDSRFSGPIDARQVVGVAAYVW